MDRSIMSIADAEIMIKYLKNVPKEIVKGYYFVRIRPDVRDRIIELLIELKKKEQTQR